MIQVPDMRPVKLRAQFVKHVILVALKFMEIKKTEIEEVENMITKN